MSNAQPPGDPFAPPPAPDGAAGQGSRADQPTPGQPPAGYGPPAPPYGQPPTSPSTQAPYGQQPSYPGPGYGAQQAYPPPSAQGYPAAPQYGAGYGASPYGVVYPKNSLGIWSLVLAIASFFTVGFLVAVPAVVLGVMGRRAADDGLADNRSQSTAGMVVGWVNIGLCVLGVVAAILFLVAFSSYQF